MERLTLSDLSELGECKRVDVRVWWFVWYVTLDLPTNFLVSWQPGIKKNPVKKCLGINP